MVGHKDFCQLFQALYPRLYSYLLARVGDPETAQDLTADAFARAWQAWGQLEHPEACATYIFSIARHLVASHYRRLLRAERANGRLSRQGDMPMLAEPDELFFHQEDKREVMEALEILSSQEQEVLRLRFEAELGSKEIGRILGIKEAYVRVVIHRALRKLRKTLLGRVAA